MIHAREDYNRIQDPALNDKSLLGPNTFPIGEKEPVFLLRASDNRMLKLLEHYKSLAAYDGQDDIVRNIDAHIVLVNDWQEKNGAHMVDLPFTTEEGDGG